LATSKEGLSSTELVSYFVTYIDIVAGDEERFGRDFFFTMKPVIFAYQPDAKGQYTGRFDSIRMKMVLKLAFTFLSRSDLLAHITRLHKYDGRYPYLM
jgi:hypothetical protein